MTNKDHSYYLQQLGVDVWTTRQTSQFPSNNAVSNDTIPNDTLSTLADVVAHCTLCPLHQSRIQTVFARGSSTAKLMIIGEAPGFNEDKQGLPFVGRAGALLNQMLYSIGLTEKEVYIVNVLKCRPPENRDPRPEEIMQCSRYLTKQIALVAPTLLLALGRFAGQYLMKEALTLNKMRNNVHYFENIPFLVSYHPAYLLRRPIDKKKAYQDLLFMKQLLAGDDK